MHLHFNEFETTINSCSFFSPRLSIKNAIFSLKLFNETIITVFKNCSIGHHQSSYHEPIRVLLIPMIVKLVLVMCSTAPFAPF